MNVTWIFKVILVKHAERISEAKGYVYKPGVACEIFDICLLWSSTLNDKFLFFFSPISIQETPKYYHEINWWLFVTHVKGQRGQMIWKHSVSTQEIQRVACRAKCFLIELYHWSSFRQWLYSLFCILGTH